MIRIASRQKNYPKNSIIFLILMSCSFAFSGVCHADPLHQKTAVLNTIVNQIEKLKANLFSAQTQQKNLQKDLKKTEINIGHLSSKLQQTQNQLSLSQNNLSLNQKNQIIYEEKLRAHEKALDEQMVGMYKIERQPFLKIILNLSEANKINRYLYYYQSLHRSHLDALKNIQAIRYSLQATYQSIQQATKTLKYIHDQQLEQQKMLEKEKNNRAQLLKNATQTISSTHEKLQELEADKIYLEKIIQKLREQELAGYAPGAHFTQLKGTLPWPITSKHLIQRFGANIEDTVLKSTGIVIVASAGTPIHAVCTGKVVFADWLRGFGLLVIIKHGPEYMTLYGRNQSIYVKPEQNVLAGDLIATVGNSGGYQESGLYFEIRHKSDPVDPQNWLKK
jgi:murein hydrolase activator